MKTRFGDVDRTFAVMDELRKRMDRLFDDYDGRPEAAAFRAGFFEPFEGAWGNRTVATWPRISVYDTGPTLVLIAEVPGMKESELKLEVHQDVLSLAGERRTEVPEGYALHRRERTPVKFSRSIGLPCKIDAEKATAVLKDGLLTLTLPKVPEAQPRQITVKTAN